MIVDVIIAGHTHAGMAHEINGIAVIESFSRGRAFGRVDLVVEPATGAVTSRRIFPPQDICQYAEPGATRCADTTGPTWPPRAGRVKPARPWAASRRGRVEGARGAAQAPTRSRSASMSATGRTSMLP